MGTDHNIHQAFLGILDGLLLLGRSPESAHQIHPNRKVLHPLGKCIVMLLGQDRGGYQIDDLLILLYCLEGCPDGNLRLSISNVPADQAVHNLMAHHIPLDGLDGKQLVFRLFKGEHFLEFPLPDCILSIYVAFLLLSCSVQPDQIFRDLSYCPSDSGFGLRPFLRAQTV